MNNEAIEILLRQGNRARRQNRRAEAIALFAEAVELCRTVGDQPMLARALARMGQSERDLGILEVSLKHYQDAVEIYRTLDDPLVLALTVRHVGDILRNLTRLELAESCYVEALAIYRNSPQTSPLDLANAIRGFAILKADTGDAEAARQLWQEARRLYAAVNVQPGVAESEWQIAHLTAD
jgi:tetratricopeptide (TPR) repeat protein